MTPSQAPKSWFQEHFNEDYLVLYEGRTDAQASDQVRAITPLLDLRPGARVLDLCCGAARHLRALLAAGCDAVGLDLSPALLESASCDPALQGRLIRGDMRHLPFAEASFDRVVSFFTSFGYFEDEREHRRAAAEIARMLEPRDGRFSLDLMNRDQIIGKLVPVSHREIDSVDGPISVVETRRFDTARQRVEKTIRMTQRSSGSTREYFESVRVFTLDEARSLLSSVGLQVHAVHGDFDGREFNRDAPRMLLIGGRE